MKFSIVFVSNKKYLSKFIKTYTDLREIGKYNGEVTLIIGNDLKIIELIKRFNDKLLNIKKFPDIKFTSKFMKNFKNLNRKSHWIQSKFQYHKFYLFDIYFKQWDYIFYIDCGIKIHKNIQPMFNLIHENKLIAHSDCHPKYNQLLNCQFDKINPIYKNLNKEYDLNIDYFQTTIMLYDTHIIKETTFKELYDLAHKYPISITNDQGIIALYFTNIKKLWKQIKLNDGDNYYYHYVKFKNKKFIMSKIIEK